ncbi:enolase C-terminal domain-like protein [Streptomyces sp. enrichment culture]|uniref:enolase C-terminal domain-like protein n=1 Tax=Streptomyces sp. enrichment culture TaxID=1795815 RepID=UPI003F556E85
MRAPGRIDEHRHADDVLDPRRRPRGHATARGRIPRTRLPLPLHQDRRVREEGGPTLDAERITACLADRRSGEFFLVDTNGGLLAESALRMLRLLPHGLDFTLEAPCATWRETMSLRHHCPYPIIVDELAETDADIAFALAHDAADGIGLKISKAGGLTHARRHRDLARAAGMTTTVQNTVGSAIAFAGIVHLGATVPPQMLRSVLNCADMVTLQTARFEAVGDDGFVRPSDAAGLGLEVDEDVLGPPVSSWSI